MQSNPTIICKIKATPSQCRYKSAAKQQACIPEDTQLIPMFLMIPLKEKSYESSKRKANDRCLTSATIDDSRTSKPTNDLKFPEMRGGILFTRCHCVHRDGLQDCCPLTACQDEPKCLLKPWPSCLPAKYLQSRHPQQYPPFN